MSFVAHFKISLTANFRALTMASASLAEQVDNVLGLAESWNQTHLAEVLTFLDHKGDK